MDQNLYNQAKSCKSADELLALAKENGVEFTEEQAQNYFNQIHTSGELSDSELDSVAGGGCNIDTAGGTYTIVSCGVSCFTGMYERGYVPEYRDFVDSDGVGKQIESMGAIVRSDNKNLRQLWLNTSHGFGRCGNCLHLEFKGGTGYCGMSGK